MMRRSLNSGKIPVELGHTLLNHFVLLDCRGMEGLPMEYLFWLARILCTTPLADDLLVLQDSPIADVRLRVLGGDGHEADFCGNGMIYAAAKVGEEMSSNRIKVESASGVKMAVKLNGEWKVEIGPAVLLTQELTKIPGFLLQGKPVFGLVRAGEPHLVIDTPASFNGVRMNQKDFEDYCRPLRDITGIKGGVNITMVFEVKDRNALIRTYERGSQRQTFSCGTGSVSAAAVLFRTPLNGSEFDIFSPGGRHTVVYEQNEWFIKAAPQRIINGYLTGSGLHLPFSGLLAYPAHNALSSKFIMSG
ncbi:MAG: hypothetical protein AB1611_19950 [bacterium]